MIRILAEAFLFSNHLDFNAGLRKDLVADSTRFLRTRAVRDIYIRSPLRTKSGARELFSWLRGGVGGFSARGVTWCVSRPY